MNNFLAGIAVLLIAALSALFAVPRVVNWDSYRGVIEEEATRLLGRDVRVGGGVKVRLLPSPTFSVNDIRIADTEANSGEPFFRADALKGKLAIAPLLRGTIQAREMVLTRPLLHLVLDGEGGGNWKTLGQGAAGRMGYMPSDVALDEVRIEGGILGVYGPDKAERLRLESIDGILSAQAMDGPFRFRGFFGADPQRRDLRLSTTKQEPDGSIRFKAAVKQLDTGSSYAFDARAVDLSRSPRLEGELTAQVPLPQLTGPQASTPAGQRSEPEAPVEVKAALIADLKSVKLANLTLAFERHGRPQILTGQADVDLSQNVTMRTELSAKWLDLDQVIGLAPVVAGVEPAQLQRGPIAGLLTLAQRLNGFNLDQGRTALALNVEQANLGREAVSSLRLVLNGTGAETDIQELRIGLPGGARADVKGLMTGSGEETAFNGDIVLRGTSLARFLGWSSGGVIALDPARDGPFAMRSKIATAAGSVVAREFVGELAGTVMQGELGYRWQGRPEVSVLVEGPQVDLRALLPDRPASGRVGSLLSTLSAGSLLGAHTKDLDAVLRIRAGQLLVPGASYQDAFADIELRDGRLRIGQLKLSANHGVTLDLEGDIPTLETQPRGTVRGIVSAKDAAGLAVLADLIALPADVLPEAARRSAIMPLRMAGSATFGTAGTAPLDVTADGDMAGTRVRVRGRFDRGVDAWRTAPLDLTLRLDGAGAPQLASAFASTPLDTSQTAATVASSIAVQANGIFTEGLVTRLSTASGDTSAEFRGRIAARDTASSANKVLSYAALELTGDVDLKSQDGSRLAQLLPALARLNLEPVPVDAQVSLASKPDGTDLNRLTARIGETTTRGQIQIKHRDSGGVHLTGRLESNTLPLTSALRPVLVPRPAIATAAADVLSSSDWPTATFDKSLLNNVSGEIAIEAGRVSFPGSSGLRNARTILVLAPGRIELRDIEGVAAGGRWSGALKLDAVADGMAATTVLRAHDLQLADIQASTGASVSGAFSGLFTLSGRAPTPKDLIASLNGRGSLALAETKVTLLTPAVVTGALDAAMRGPADALGATLRQRLAAGVATPQQPVIVAARTLPFEVKNGIVTLAPVTAEKADGRTTANLALDLGTMTLNGTWRVELGATALPASPSWTATVAPSGAAPAPAKPQAPLPPVTVTFAGPLGALSQGKAEYNTDALEREVSVRKVERDLEDLERLRRLDEERAKEEANRRKLLEQGAVAPALIAPNDTTGVPTATTQAQDADAATQPSAVPDSVDPALKPKAAVPVAVPAPTPAPKPAYRPLPADEHRSIFSGR